MTRRMGSIFTLYAIVVTFGHAEGQEQDTFKQELKAMAGVWQPIYSETDGNVAPDDRLKMSSVTRDEDGKVVGRLGDKVVIEAVVKTIDATRKPKRIDSELTGGEMKGKVIEGIYEIDGDILRICVVLPGRGERPTEFGAKAGSSNSFTIYKRVKK